MNRRSLSSQVVLGAIIVGHYRSRSRGVADSLISSVGGSEQRSTMAAFEGSDPTTLLGGVELGLREAGIEDRPATINATALCGGL
ncbi:hypothetical protein [Halorhabdus rudnickae]|uniref:hypothetical protein n=1 Tax=Halorhabdus rudnickae TaxID=1775544 RepID=UPI001083CEAA|nr:hypothetical protein [Halorhabdus rudnickae]